MSNFLPRSLVALVAFVVLVPSVCRGVEVPADPQRALELTVEALLNNDEPDACERMADLLGRVSPVVDVGAALLEVWWSTCDPSVIASSLVRAAKRVDLHPVTRWRLWTLAEEPTVRSVLPEADRLRMPLQEALSVRWLPAGAPHWLVFAFRPVTLPEKDDGFGHAIGGIRHHRWWVETHEEAVVDLALDGDAQGTLYVDGEPVGVNADTRSRWIGAAWINRVEFSVGTHEILFVEVVDMPSRLLELGMLPLSGTAEFVESSGSLPGVSKLVTVSPAEGSGVPSDLMSLWLGCPPEGGFEALADRASLEPAALLAYVAYGRVWRSSELSPHTMIAVLSVASEQQDAHCLPVLELARLTLNNGEEDLADTILEQAVVCRGSQLWYEVELDRLNLRNWPSVAHEVAEEARHRFPTNCRFQAERKQWLESHWESSAIMDSDACFADDKVDVNPEGGVLPTVNQWMGASETQRQGWLTGLWNAGDGSWRRGLERWFEVDPQAAWWASDRAAVEGKNDLAKELGRLARSHRGAYASVRISSGSLDAWDALLGYVVDPEEVVRDYLDSGFSPEAPQVFVLDETMVLPDVNGWAAGARTVILHLKTPSSVESVGELELGVDQQLQRIAVRKADGRWISPGDESLTEAKETMSLAGLGVGDILLVRTLHEVQSSYAFPVCYSLPVFKLGSALGPSFLSRRVVVKNPDLPLLFRVTGEVERNETDWAWFFWADQLPVNPVEPGDPDPESGLRTIAAMTPCYTWATVRDQWADRLYRLCDVPAPSFLPKEASVPEIVRLVRTFVEPGNAEFLSQPYSEILRAGRGNPSTALYCSLLQSGHDVRVVLVNSLAAPPLRKERPSVEPFDSVLLRVRGKQDIWIDGGAVTAPPGEIREALQHRPALVLDPLYPKIFVETPETGVTASWLLDTRIKLEKTEALVRLQLRIHGAARYDLTRLFAKRPAAEQESTAAGFLNKLVPGATLTSFSLDDHSETVLTVVGTLPLPSQGPLSLELALLPDPEPADRLLPSRTRTLFYDGLAPVTAHVVIEDEAGWDLETSLKAAHFEFTQGKVGLKVTARSSRIEVTRTAQYRPSQITPDQYPEFLKFQRALYRTRVLSVEGRR